MAPWITLLELALTGATKYYSHAAVPSPSAFYEPRVLEFGQLDRVVPVRPGLPSISNTYVKLNNVDRHFSQLLAQYEVRGRNATFKIGIEGASLASFSTIYTGKVVSIGLEPGVCVLGIRDASADKWKEPLYGKILAKKFPNLPVKQLTTQGNVIFGKVTSEGKTDQGIVPCPLVDTADHLYLVAVHRCQLIPTVYYPDSFVGDFDEADIEELYDDDGWTYLQFPIDVEDTDFPNEYSVVADVWGIEDVGDSSGNLITCPAEALKTYLIDYVGHSSGEIDTLTYDALRAAQKTNGYALAGIINTLGWTHEQAIEQLMQAGSQQIFFGAGNTIKWADYKVETAAGTEPQIMDAPRVAGFTRTPVAGNTIAEILEGSLSITQNQDVINQLTLHYDYDGTQGKYLREPEPYKNLSSQDNLGTTLEEDLSLSMVADSATAYAVVNNRMYYSDEDRYVVGFDMSAPQVPGSGVDLAANIRLTHYAGINATLSGWSNELMKITALSYELNDTPMVRAKCLTMDPGTNAFDFTTPPTNVTFGVASESAQGEVTVTWTHGASTAYNIHVYYKPATDKLSQVRYAGYVLASAETHTFTPYDSADIGNLDIYLVPESAGGIIRELGWMIDPDTDTTITEDLDLTEIGINVADTTTAIAGDYVMVGSEIVRVNTVQVGVAWHLYNFLYSAPATYYRTQYEDTVASTHANGAAIGKYLPTVAYGTDSGRTSCTAVADLSHTISGATVVLDWSDVAGADDIAMFKHWEVWRGSTSTFADATKLTTGSELVVSTYTDSSPGASSSLHYWVTSVTRSGVRSTESNTLGPLDDLWQLASVSVTVTGATFKADIAPPTDVAMNLIDFFEESYSPNVWDGGNLPGAPTGVGAWTGNIGPNRHVEGTKAGFTAYFAFRCHFTAGYYGTWTYYGSAPGYTPVTSAAYASYPADSTTANFSGALTGFESHVLSAGDNHVFISGTVNTDIEPDAHYGGEFQLRDIDYSWATPSGTTPTIITLLSGSYPTGAYYDGDRFSLRYAPG